MVGPADGLTTTDQQETWADRYLIDSVDTGGRFSLVEHTLEARVLAAPLHLHTREDEYSFVLEGRLGVLLGDQEVFAEPGTLVFKPRNQWHTFWNAGDERLRLLELISPGGIEALFRKLAEPGGEYDPETLPELAGSYGCEVDFDQTMPIIERHRLVF
jgi:mannose-6-phosphate isomerase-like protein (cupin superfamily)